MSGHTVGEARSLAARYYRSPSIFDTEMEHIFSRRWVYAGRRSSLEGPGRYFLADAGGENLILVQDRRGRGRAFYNVCRHRGTRLCDVASGRFGASIRCAYHGWCYDLDGRLVAAPAMEPGDGFHMEDFPLHEASVATWEGGLFLHLSAEAAPLAEAFAPLEAKFRAWRLPELVVSHRAVYDVAANWKLIIQNYSECYHCPSLHPTLNRLTPSRDATNDLLEGPFLGGPMRLAPGASSLTTSGRACARPLPGVLGDDLRRVYYYTIFPNMLLSLHPDYVLVHQIRPLRPDRTQVVCEWLFHPDAVSREGFDPRPAVDFWDMTNTQDWHVSELSQQGIASRVYSPGLLSRLESMVAAWDGYYLRALGE